MYKYIVSNNRLEISDIVSLNLCKLFDKRNKINIRINIRIRVIKGDLWPRAGARAPRCFRSDKLHQDFILSGKVVTSLNGKMLENA